MLSHYLEFDCLYKSSYLFQNNPQSSKGYEIDRDDTVQYNLYDSSSWYKTPLKSCYLDQVTIYSNLVLQRTAPPESYLDQENFPLMIKYIIIRILKPQNFQSTTLRSPPVSCSLHIFCHASCGRIQ